MTVVTTHQNLEYPSFKEYVVVGAGRALELLIQGVIEFGADPGHEGRTGFDRRLYELHVEVGR